MIPKYFIPHDLALSSQAVGAWAAYASATWPVANDAIFVPWFFPEDCLLYEIRAAAANATGNYDIGIYDDAFGRLDAKGSTAMAAGTLSFSLASDLNIEAGRLYYAGLALSSSSGSAYRSTTGSVARHVVANTAKQATAFPLPSTITPVAITADYVPLLIAVVR